MRCTSFVVQGHTLPSQTFFEPVIAQVTFSDSLLEILVLTLEINDLVGMGFPDSITRKPLLAGFQDILTPAVIQVGMDALLTEDCSS